MNKKKIKLLVPTLTISCLGLATAAAITSCSNKEVTKVSTANELAKALTDKKSAISFKNDIEVSNQVELDYNVVIYGNGHKLTRKESSNASFESIIGISHTSSTNLSFKFHDLTIDCGENDDKMIGIFVEGTGEQQNSGDISISLTNSIINSRRYGIYTRNNTYSNINLTIRKSKVSGWYAINNAGNNLKIDAKDSKFIGTKRCEASPDYESEVICLAHSAMLQHDSVNYNLNQNNSAKFDGCEITAKIDEKYQSTINHQYYPIGIYSPMNNSLVLNKTTITSETGADSRIMVAREVVQTTSGYIYFNQQFFNEDTFMSYKSGSYKDIPNSVENFDGLVSYARNHLSYVTIDGQPITHTTGNVYYTYSDDQSNFVIKE